MKTKLLLLIGACLFLFKYTNAQITETSDCQVLRLSVEDYLKSSDYSQKKSKELFKAVKGCAETGDADAACNMGIFYKDGIGCKLDFDQSRTWFEIAYELGSQKAAYSLGYLYFKGLGGINQDYVKAVQWFKKSDYPMARHWLAQCYYFGYGTAQDKQKALQILKDNPIGNSQILFMQLDSEESNSDKPSESSNSSLRTIPLENSSKSFASASVEPIEIQDKDVVGDWVGELVEMDWSGKNEIQRLPISFKVAQNEQAGLKTTFTFKNESFEGQALLENSSLIFPVSYLELPKKYTDHPEKLTLDYRLVSLKFQLSDNTLIGRLETNIENWSEPGPPIYLHLSKTAQALDDEALEAFKNQEKDFIKVYPNPFEADVLIRYVLNSDSRVRLSIQDFYGRTAALQLSDENQSKGEQTMSFGQLASLPSGLFVIRLEINDNDYTKIVIKK